MHIERMKNKHLKEIINVDEIAFNRTEKRNLENLESCRLSDSEGCFVLLDGNRVVGYSYSRTMGSHGYLGPLSIIPPYQNQSYGKQLIAKNLEYLKSNCKVVGLEVLPESGDNIGLYNKLGFFTGLPSLLFEFPEEINFFESKFEFKVLSETSNHQQQNIIEKIDSWTGKLFDGVSYARDIGATIDYNGLVLVAFEEKIPVAFLAYSKTALPYLWGVVKPVEAQKEIMKDILTYFNVLYKDGDVMAQVNSRYHHLIDLLTEMDFKVYRSVNRMLLKGYEGNQLEKSKEMVMRGWRG